MNHVTRNTTMRDSAIIQSFNHMTEIEIERIFRTQGGLYATKCFAGKNAASVVCERPDKWILEIRYGTTGNNVWIKATTKTISDKEREWVLDWLSKLGFDPAEAIIYFNSNIPRKRDIAVKVGQVLTMLRDMPDAHVTGVLPEHKAARQVLSSIDALVNALQSSGRITRHCPEVLAMAVP